MAENMSFLPEDYLEKRIARRTNIICITLFGLVIVGVAAALFVTDRQRSEVRAELAKVNQAFEDAAKKLEQLEQLQKQKTQMVHKAKVASVLLERVPRTLLLAELVNHMPNQLSLLELDVKTEVKRDAPRPRTALDRAKSKSKAGKTPEMEIAAPVTEVTLRLVGVAPTDVEVAQFMNALSGHSLFRDVTLQYSEQTTIDSRELRKFGIELKLDQDTDLRKIEPTVVERELKMDPMGGTVTIAPPDAVEPAPATEPVGLDARPDYVKVNDEH